MNAVVVEILSGGRQSYEASTLLKIYAEASILRTHAPGGTKCGGSLPRMWIRTRTKLTHIAEDKNIDTKLPALTVCAWDFIGRLSFRYTARD